MNAGRRGFFKEMARKVVHRTESDSHGEATAWAALHAEAFEQACEDIDAALWAETSATMATMRAECIAELARIGEDLGGGGAYELLYFLTRHMAADVVVETGVAAGWSSRAILQALRRNGRGHLYSSDFPYFRLSQPERFIGVLVPADWRADWTLDIRGDRIALPAMLRSIATVNLFHYDSDKSVAGRQFAMAEIALRLNESSVVIMDDIQNNTFFRDLVQETAQPFRVFEFEGKYLGVLGFPNRSESVGQSN